MAVARWARIITAFFTTALFTALLGLPPAVHAQGPADWTEWRGPGRDGVLPSFAEPSPWPEALTLRWKIDVGTGYATPLVSGNRIYVFSRQGEDEVMSALDANTGKVLWRTAYAAPFEMHKSASRHGPGPKSTPVLHDGRLYAIGMTGAITAFDAATGKEVWKTPGSQPLTLYTSHAFSPIVEGDVVIFHLGGHDKGALTAFDLATGSERWRWEGDGPGYGSPIVTEFDGVRQLVVATQRKVIGIDPRSGTLLWERPLVTSSTSNSVTPLRYGPRIIMSSTNLPVTAFTVTRREGGWVTENAWENAEASYRMSNAVVVDDTVFSLSTLAMGQYFALDAATGQTLWRSEGRQAGYASILRSGSLLFILEDDGELVVARSSRTGFEPLRRYKVADAETWTPLVISGSRVFVKDVSTLALWTLTP